MEYLPAPIRVKTLVGVRKTGALLVDQRDRIISLEATAESHAIVRAILKSPLDPRGCDLYVSRFPCSMCVKMASQAGIRKIYYFPAIGTEMDWEAWVDGREHDSGSPTKGTREEQINEKISINKISVSRLIQNNPTAMSRIIPIWCSTIIPDLDPTLPSDLTGVLWDLDDSHATDSPYAAGLMTHLSHLFQQTIAAVNNLRLRYKSPPTCSLGDGSASTTAFALWQHAVVLAHIAAKRTDDPKIGVGAVLVYSDGTYGGIGWNGYPREAEVLDYPQAGADDFVEQDLKYDYVLHAEQNALLWRMDAGKSLAGSTIVSTKMPCSPVLFDCGVRRVVANVQVPKSSDDPARLRGLTYDKIRLLMTEIWLF